jgi:hypothetical protein
MACGPVVINCGYSNLLASSDVVILALAGLKRSKIFSAAQFTRFIKYDRTKIHDL